MIADRTDERGSRLALRLAAPASLCGARSESRFRRPLASRPLALDLPLPPGRPPRVGLSRRPEWELARC